MAIVKNMRMRVVFPSVSIALWALLSSGHAAAQTAPAVAAAQSNVQVYGLRKEPLNVFLAKASIRVQARSSGCSMYLAPGQRQLVPADSLFGYANSLRGYEDKFLHIEDVSVDQRATYTLSDCEYADAVYMRGREHILSRDKSLAAGFAAMQHKDYATAIAQFTLAYKKIGYADAALMLGKIHLYGLGTPRDTTQAVKWFEEVVAIPYHPVYMRMRFDPDHPELMSPRVEAAMRLANIYRDGAGIKPDAAAAREWYAKAADSGYAPAAHILAVDGLLRKDRDVDKALDYLKEAAETGYAPSLYHLGRQYYLGEGVAQDRKMAGAYFVAAAKAGNADAMYAAGLMYDQGDSVAVDQGRAVAYYRNAAVKGQPDAQNALATYFYAGEVVAQDRDTARRLFNEAALRGQADAMFNLGVMMGLGEGGARDAAMSYVWLSLAKASAHARADEALLAVKPQLNAQDLARADAILAPASGAPRMQ